MEYYNYIRTYNMDEEVNKPQNTYVKCFLTN